METEKIFRVLIFFFLKSAIDNFGGWLCFIKGFVILSVKGSQDIRFIGDIYFQIAF